MSGVFGPASLNERRATLENLRTSPNYTSNDLLFSLNGEEPLRVLNYQTVAQCIEEVQDIQNAPAVSMWPYLVSSSQTDLLAAISIYSQPGESREQLRLLFMNATALRIWKEMDRRPRMIGTQHRPPSTARLVFGVPFSE